ncbi:MAG TPA: Hpt domain-containing protein [Candidatus Limnocylindrales bacterium]|nr:Hpt domain-containing protein [Candidatus Limnocylindrales bacterium]
MTETPIDRGVFEALVEMTGGEMEFVDELVDTYLDDGRQQIDALREALATGDAAALVRPAHSLKSNSLNVGALGLGGLCRELEESARSGAVPDAADRVDAIEQGFSGVRTALLAERADRSEPAPGG